MDSSKFIAVVTALATLIGAVSPIIVALIQNTEKQKSSGTILIPSGVDLPQKTKIRKNVILVFAFLGGIIGFGGANILSRDSFSQAPTVVVPVSTTTVLVSLEPTSTIFVPTESPSETATLKVVSTNTPEPSPKPSSTPSSTPSPTPSPTPDIHLGIENGCINESFWAVDEDDGIKLDGNGCFQLLDWGFFAEDRKLYILPPWNPEGQSHRLYTSLPNSNVDITFNFLVDKIQTGTRQANIRFGIISKDFDDGKFLAYHYLPVYPNNLYPRLWENGKYGDPFSVNMKVGKTQQVTMSIRGNFLTVILDGQIVLDRSVLRFGDMLFSIDYFLPPSSDLSAYISEFSIEGR